MSVVFAGVSVAPLAGVAFAGWILLLVAVCLLVVGSLFKSRSAWAAPEFCLLPTGWIVHATERLAVLTGVGPSLAARAPPAGLAAGPMRVQPAPDHHRRRGSPRNELS